MCSFPIGIYSEIDGETQLVSVEDWFAKRRSIPLDLPMSSLLLGPRIAKHEPSHMDNLIALDGASQNARKAPRMLVPSGAQDLVSKPCSANTRTIWNHRASHSAIVRDLHGCSTEALHSPYRSVEGLPSYLLDKCPQSGAHQHIQDGVWPSTM